MAKHERHPRSLTRLVTAFATDTTDGVGYTYDLARGGWRARHPSRKAPICRCGSP